MYFAVKKFSWTYLSLNLPLRYRMTTLGNLSLSAEELFVLVQEAIVHFAKFFKFLLNVVARFYFPCLSNWNHNHNDKLWQSVAWKSFAPKNQPNIIINRAKTQQIIKGRSKSQTKKKNCPTLQLSIYLFDFTSNGKISKWLRFA